MDESRAGMCRRSAADARRTESGGFDQNLSASSRPEAVKTCEETVLSSAKPARRMIHALAQLRWTAPACAADDTLTGEGRLGASR
jgi:hypothetical protein